MVQGKKDRKTLLAQYFFKIIISISPKQIEDQILKTSKKILTLNFDNFNAYFVNSWPSLAFRL